MSGLIILLVVTGALVLLGIAATYWGVDSRDESRIRAVPRTPSRSGSHHTSNTQRASPPSTPASLVSPWRAGRGLTDSQAGIVGRLEAAVPRSVHAVFRLDRRGVDAGSYSWASWSSAIASSGSERWPNRPPVETPTATMANPTMASRTQAMASTRRPPMLSGRR